MILLPAIFSPLILHSPVALFFFLLADSDSDMTGFQCPDIESCVCSAIGEVPWATFCGNAKHLVAAGCVPRVHKVGEEEEELVYFPIVLLCFFREVDDLR